MAYKHGINFREEATALTAPATVDSAVIVAIGTAPVNLAGAEDPIQPQIAYTLLEARNKVGYSDDMAFTLNQVTLACFELLNVGPVVYINALNPKTHKTESTTEVTMTDGTAALPQQGVLLDSVKVASGEGETQKDYTLDEDYTVAYGTDGSVVITATTDGALGAGGVLVVSYTKLDPGKVKAADIDAAIEKVSEVFPRFSVVPGVIIAPGYSGEVTTYHKMTAKTENLNSAFGSFVLADIDTKVASTYDTVGKWKTDKGIAHERSAILWPMVKVGGVPLYFSAVYAALIAYTDAANDGVPYVSPSNKPLPIEGLCDEDGGEIILDMEQANLLNSQGINTALNMMGWRSWGNYTACYPVNSDPKDAFIPIRRFFSWWGNTFIQTYFDKVDDPMNLRLVESIIDSENIRANGFMARFQIADAHMELLSEDNTDTDLMNGNLTVRQSLTPYPPAQSITNITSFDPTALGAALGLA